MADSIGFVNMIKRVALAAVRASKPVEVCFGRVTEESPLKILVEQKLTLGKAQLIFSRHVTDYETALSGGKIQNAADTTPPQDRNPHRNNKKTTGKRMLITVHNGLAVGDEVILLRQQG
ncbi:MAG: DUF2577 domain-containing protein, partial [Lachnospiraceae bacterium]|nr:DUF2577 domain-containing protein [Lachnospiraceae bacterium]